MNMKRVLSVSVPLGKQLLRAERAGRRTSARAMALVAVSALALAGCAYLQEEEASPQTVTDREKGSSYPNLASVPEQAPEVTPPEKRQELLESLAADRSQARYSDQPLIPPDTDGITTSHAADGVQPETLVITSQGASAPPVESAGDSGAATQSAASVVNADGFVTEGRRTMVGVVYFDHASTKLDAGDRDVLRQVAALHSQRGGRVIVYGHASQRTLTSQAESHKLANFETSFDRATAVSKYLERQGVPSDSIVSVARGSAEPVYYEFMPTGEAGNRRVEVYLER